MQLSTLILLAPAIVSILALPTPSLNQTVDELILAPTAKDRVALLTNTDFVFDFFNATPAAVTSGEDGSITLARRDTFPALVGSGLAMALGRIGPCGLNTPHTHPRAAELNYAINGTFHVGMLEENGARLVMNTIRPGQATIFPRGAIHFEQNLGCEEVLFLAAFSDEDPGVSQLTNLFTLPTDFLDATLGVDESEAKQLVMGIPKNVVFGAKECMARCGIKKPN
jgi:oxalate decarboxylase/phosphoglucose isomerase-like protein (cupin superfamily)